MRTRASTLPPTAPDPNQVEHRWGAETVKLEGRSLPALKARYLIHGAPEQGDVCEVGCGDGKMLRTLARHRSGLRLVGFDVRSPALPPDGFEFRLMTRVIPAPAAAFDAAILADVLEHVPDPGWTLGEVARVLRPGGRLLAFVPVEGEPWSAYEFYRRVLGRDLYRRTKEHVQAFTFAELLTLCQARFEVLDLQYAYHLMGQILDASFFALNGLDRIQRFWWTENRYYHPQVKRPSAVGRSLNRLLWVGNWAAYHESKWLSRTRFGAAGALITARLRGI
jgi:2-polyprenyl-3-methyl-5-hydroxy-6-metoxy-1,4-benzoquinol methylase